MRLQEKTTVVLDEFEGVSVRESRLRVDDAWFHVVCNCRSAAKVVEARPDVYRAIDDKCRPCTIHQSILIFPVRVVIQDRKFIKRWLSRTRKELAVSGRLAEITHLLLQQESEQEPARDWRHDLTRLLQGEWEPSMDDLIRLDGVLARPRPPQEPDQGPMLFEA